MACHHILLSHTLGPLGCCEGVGRIPEGVGRTDCHEGVQRGLHGGSVWGPGCYTDCEGEGVLSAWGGGFQWEAWPYDSLYQQKNG